MVLAVMAKFSLTFILGLFIQVLFEGRTLTSCTCIKLTWATYVTAKDKSVPQSSLFHLPGPDRIYLQLRLLL